MPGFSYCRHGLILIALFWAMPSANCDAAPAQLGKYHLSVVTSGLDHPWSMVFIADDEMLITEMPGRLVRVKQGKIVSWIKGLPKVLYKGQGGLLDIALHPDYPNHPWIYLSYISQQPDGNSLQVMRAHLHQDKLTDQQILFTAHPAKTTIANNGGRLTFLADNSLIISVGDGFDYREQAQRLNSDLGKLIRISDDGQIPANNPFIHQPQDDGKIYSLGHRNPQGLAYDPGRKLLFSDEHGPAGGDEINIIVAGHNYGWPVITKGKDYSGALISPYTVYPGMEQPMLDWTPSIAPSSIMVYRGAAFPAMEGDLLVTTLKSRELRWVQMKGLAIVGQKSLLRHLNQRFRDITTDRQGNIYLLTDGDNARLIKMAPTKPTPSPPAVTPGQ